VFAGSGYTRVVLRAWILSAAGAAAAVVIVLAMTRQDTHGEEEKPKPPPVRVAPKPLDENEVRLYLATFPEMLEAIKQINAQLAAEWRKEGRFPQHDPQFQRRIQEAVEVALQRHHLTHAEFDRIRGRVEYVIDVMRYEQSAGERRTKTLEQLRVKESAAELQTDPKMKELLERDIARLKEQLDAAGPPISDADRKLVTRYWDQLEPVALRTNASPRSRTQPSESGNKDEEK
jgi:hypothetical protein